MMYAMGDGDQVRRRLRRRARRLLRRGLSHVEKRPGLLGQAACRMRSRIDPNSLLNIAVRSGRPIGRPLADLLVEIEAMLSRVQATKAAIFVGEQSVGVPAWIARRWPKLRLLCMTPSTECADRVLDAAAPRSTLVVVNQTGVSARHVALTTYGKYDVLIDSVPRSFEERLALLRETLFHLRKHGRYLTTDERDPQGSRRDLYEVVARSREHSESGSDIQFLAATRDLRHTRHTVSFTSTVAALSKLRYYEMDEVLSRRPSLGRHLSSLSAVTYASKSVVTMNRDVPPFPLASEIRVPSLGIREYDEVLCAPYQVLISHGMLLPDTYRHYLNTTLSNGLTKELTDRFARYSRPRGPALELSGPHFYLGSEVPQHFGHVMTEQLSRLWAWQEVKKRYPSAKAIVDVRSRHDGLKPYEYAIFGAAGVAEDDLVGVKGPVRVEKLVAAAPMMVNTQYVHPGIVDLWSRTAENLMRIAPARQHPDKIFVSRRDKLGNRRCTNARDVESFFEGRGFAVVYPEDHSVSDQVVMFRKARIVAGSQAAPCSLSASASQRR